MTETKMIRVLATMSSDLDCHVNVPATWSEDQCWEYAKDHLDGGEFIENKLSGDWNTYDCQILDEDEAMAVMKVVANDGDVALIDADPTVFDEDPMRRGTGTTTSGASSSELLWATKSSLNTHG